MSISDEIKKHKIYIIIGSVIFCLLLIIFLLYSWNSESDDDPQLESMEEWISEGSPDTDLFGDEALSASPDSENTTVTVDVKGAVNYPGLYVLQQGDRVNDAIELAGGLISDADADRVNFARVLADEMFIYIPLTGEEIPDVKTGSEMTGDQVNKININNADEELLTELSGIGPQKAKDIIKYREENGGFSNIEEITQVTGIGEKTLEKIRETIVVK